MAYALLRDLTTAAQNEGRKIGLISAAHTEGMTAAELEKGTTLYQDILVRVRRALADTTSAFKGILWQSDADGTDPAALKAFVSDLTADLGLPEGSIPVYAGKTNDPTADAAIARAAFRGFYPVAYSADADALGAAFAAKILETKTDAWAFPCEVSGVSTADGQISFDLHNRDIAGKNVTVFIAGANDQNFEQLSGVQLPDSRFLQAGGTANISAPLPEGAVYRILVWEAGTDGTVLRPAEAMTPLADMAVYPAVQQ